MFQNLECVKWKSKESRENKNKNPRKNIRKNKPRKTTMIAHLFTLISQAKSSGLSSLKTHNFKLH